MWRDVPEADGGDRRDAPVDRHGDTGESVLWSFDNVHDGREHDDRDHDEAEKYDDFPPTRDQGGTQVPKLGHVCAEFEDSEDAQQAQQSHVDQRMGFRQQERKVGRQDGEKVDDAEEAQGITQRVTDAGKP